MQDFNSGNTGQPCRGTRVAGSPVSTTKWTILERMNFVSYRVAEQHSAAWGEAGNPGVGQTARDSGNTGIEATTGSRCEVGSPAFGGTGVDRRRDSDKRRRTGQKGGGNGRASDSHRLEERISTENGTSEKDSESRGARGRRGRLWRRDRAARGQDKKERRGAWVEAF